MQYLRGKMLAVTSAVRRELEERQGMSVMQQPVMETPRQDQVVDETQKRKITETAEDMDSEVKRIKINPMEVKIQMDNIVDEEFKRISLGIEKQTRAIHLKTTEATESKVSDFGSELKRTIINKPLSDTKPTRSGNVLGSKTEYQLKKTIVSDSTSHANQDQKPEKLHRKRQWDDPEGTSKDGKYRDDRRSHQKQSPSYRSTRTPPRSYRTKVSPPRQPMNSGRKTWSLKDDRGGKDRSPGRDTGRKTSTEAQSKNVLVIDKDRPRENVTATPVVKYSTANPSSSGSSNSGQPTSSSTTTTAASSAPSFKFGWMAKTPRPAPLVKPGVQYGPMPGRKAPPPTKGKATMLFVF